MNRLGGTSSPGAPRPALGPAPGPAPERSEPGASGKERIALTPEPLTQAAFRPFGDVLSKETCEKKMHINEGTTWRFHKLAQLDVSAHDGTPIVSWFTSTPRPFPFCLRCLEKHPLGSQAFFRSRRIQRLSGISSSPRPGRSLTWRKYALLSRRAAKASSIIAASGIIRSLRPRDRRNFWSWTGRGRVSIWSRKTC